MRFYTYLYVVFLCKSNSVFLFKSNCGRRLDCSIETDTRTYRSMVTIEVTSKACQELFSCRDPGQSKFQLCSIVFTELWFSSLCLLLLTLKKHQRAWAHLIAGSAYRGHYTLMTCSVCMIKLEYEVQISGGTVCSFTLDKQFRELDVKLCSHI